MGKGEKSIRYKTAYLTFKTDNPEKDICLMASTGVLMAVSNDSNYIQVRYLEYIPTDTKIVLKYADLRFENAIDAFELWRLLAVEKTLIIEG